MTRRLLVLAGLCVATESLYSPPPQRARGASGARGRGTSTGPRAASGRGRGRGARGRETEEERRRDLFGEPGEWQARARSGGYKKWRAERDQRLGDAYEVGESNARLADFAPKVWSTEAGGGRPASFFAKKATSFADLGASEELVAALLTCGYERPSHVQAAGFSPVVEGADVALADQTGSGKTIAFLAPIVQSLRAIEAREGQTPEGHVRAIVLTPTSELAQQTLSVAKELAAAGVPFRSSSAPHAARPSPPRARHSALDVRALLAVRAWST